MSGEGAWTNDVKPTVISHGPAARNGDADDDFQDTVNRPAEVALYQRPQWFEQQLRFSLGEIIARILYQTAGITQIIDAILSRSCNPYYMIINSREVTLVVI